MRATTPTKKNPFHPRLNNIKMSLSNQSMQREFYVSIFGDDAFPGTSEKPFATIQRAQDAVRIQKQTSPGDITVIVRGGTYSLSQPLSFSYEDSGDYASQVIYRAFPGETVTLSGGMRLTCDWMPYKDGIMMCRLSQVAPDKLSFDQLFINGKRQIRARFPNFDGSDPKNYTGYIQAAGRIGDEVEDPNPLPDSDMTFSGVPQRGITFDPVTFTPKCWTRPDEAIIHIYQAHYWGNMQWQVKDIDRENCRIWFGMGGQQMGAKWFDAPNVVNQNSRFFIENVFEELDAPGEWYLDREAGVLYYYPVEGVNLNEAVIEVPVLQQIVRIKGSQAQPVSHITLDGFRFTQTRATFLETYAVPSLSDWSIHRGGAVFLEGARNCHITNCYFDAVGGNAVFMNLYNRGNTVTGCKFTETGDSAICFVGSQELTSGSQRSFPYECRAENNLIHDCGVFGKQIAGVYISRAKRITAGHNRIFNMPRAGICIGDGTWGGHVIAYNHIYNTCRGTGDHGPFNSWGRDLYWCLAQSHLPYTTGRSHDAGHVHVDAMEPVIVRNNFFEEDAGWGLDLDDGASNYEIYNNLCVGVSMKLREGAYRTIYNNIWVNGANSPCFHVGNENNHDRYFRNITVMSVQSMKPEDDLNFRMGKTYGEIYTLIAPPAHGPWLEEVDYNCFYSDLGKFVARVETRAEGTYEEDWGVLSQRRTKTKYSLEQWQALGFDQHSVFSDPLFQDPQNKDYQLRPESPALKLGFVNFDAREAGLTADFPKQWLDQD
jgi:hypothetical protein